MNQLTTPSKDLRVASPINSPRTPGHLLTSPGHPNSSISLTSRLIPKNNSITFTPQQVVTSSVLQGIKNLDATARKIEEDKKIDERKFEDSDIYKYMKSRFDEIDEKIEVALVSREVFRGLQKTSGGNSKFEFESFSSILEQEINQRFTNDDDFETVMNNLKQIRTTIKIETSTETIVQIFLRKNHLEEADSRRHYWCLLCKSRIPLPRDMKKSETGCFRIYVCRSDDGEPC